MVTMVTMAWSQYGTNRKRGMAKGYGESNGHMTDNVT